MSGNVYPNPGPIFPCSVCAGNVTWRSKAVQCCTCFKGVHLRCSQLFLSSFRTLNSSHSWICVPTCNTVTILGTPPTCIPPLYNLALRLLKLHSLPTLVFKPLIPVGPFCIFFLCPLTTVPCSWLSLYASCLLSSVFQWNAGGLRARSTELLHFLSTILLTLSVSRNPILTHFPLSGILDSLLCVLLPPTPGLAFSLVMPRTLAAVSSFSSGRAYFFLNFLSPLFLRSVPTLVM